MGCDKMQHCDAFEWLLEESATDRKGSRGVGRSTVAHRPARFEQARDSPPHFVNPIFDQARARHVSMLPRRHCAFRARMQAFKCRGKVSRTVGLQVRARAALHVMFGAWFV